jgi:23S rRNA (uracil1939-C5)-methyltransferase
MKKADRKPQPILENVSITDAGSDGQSVGKLENMVVFVKDAVPGDVVDVQVTRKKSNYREGRAIKWHQLSDKRTKPECEHFGVCGGCKWQNMKYEWQLFYKQKQVNDALTRIGKIELPEIAPILPSKQTYYYRNKLEFSFSNKMWLTQEEVDSNVQYDNRNALGFHIPKMFDKILDIKNCHLQAEPSNSIRLEIKKFAIENNLSFFDYHQQKGLLRNLIIRTSSTGETMVVIVFCDDDKKAHKDLLEHIAAKFPTITSLLYVINQKKNDTISDLDVKIHKGNDFIYEQMSGLKFKISPKSFYQTNSEQAYELYKIASSFAGLKGDEVVYDLYTGTGTIANFIAKKAKKVIGIEYIESAIEDAKVNSGINNINNTSFYSGDIKDILNDAFIAQNGKPDIIITDPPRIGMHEDVTRKILEIEPQKIVYVSCNPSTQARDLLLLDPKYKVVKVQPVDMFPQTHHVENVVLLERK